MRALKVTLTHVKLACNYAMFMRRVDMYLANTRFPVGPQGKLLRTSQEVST